MQKIRKSQKLYENIAANYINKYLAEATKFDGMDPEIAERFRRVMNRYASYKSKKGSAKSAAKLQAEFEDLIQHIQNAKAKAKVQVIIDSLKNVTGMGSIIPSTTNEPNIPQNTNTEETGTFIEDEDDDDESKIVDEPTNEPEIPVNDVKEPEDYPAYDEVDIDEPTEDNTKDYPAYDEIETDDIDTDVTDDINDEISNTSVNGAEVLEYVKSIAATILTNEQKKDLRYYNWEVTQTDEGYRLIVLNKLQLKPTSDTDMVYSTAEIEEACLECDQMLKPVILKALEKYNLPENVLDTCLYDEDETYSVYGIDFDPNYKD